MYGYTVNAQMHSILPICCTNAFATLQVGGLAAFNGRKKARALAGFSLRNGVNERTYPTKTHDQAS